MSLPKSANTIRRHAVQTTLMAIVGFGSILVDPTASASEPETISNSSHSRFEDAVATKPRVFEGTNASIRWSEQGDLHAVYIGDFDGARRVAYRRIEPAMMEARPVSPLEFRVREHAEMPPTLEILPDGTLVVTYVVSLPGFRKSALYVQRSQDHGRSWQTPVLLHDDGESGGHAFFATALDSQGRVLFAWLDGRSGQQGLVTASSKDGKTITPNQLVDERTCQCCGTAILARGDGTVWIAYRDLTRDVSNQEIRDISLITSRDGGQTFDQPYAVWNDRWVIDGCPHTGPRLALAADGALWASWYTGASSGIFVARSTGSGGSFSDRVRIADGRHPEIGVLPSGRIVVLYEARANGRQSIMARASKLDDDHWMEPIVIAQEGRHPRMTVRGDNVAIAFSSVDNDAKGNINVLVTRFVR